MTLEEVMKSLEEMGTEQTKKTFMRHGAKEPFFGVRIGDMKKLVKYVKKDQDLALALYSTGNSDAMYLAGLSINPKLMTKEQLQNWAKEAQWFMIAESIVSAVAAESQYAIELAKEWMNSDEELIETCGWSTYSHYLSIAPDEEIDKEEVRKLLNYIEMNIHTSKNRVRYTMNGFVIAVGSFVPSLTVEATMVAQKVGKVQVNVGNTACKVPLATDYIEKVEAKGKLGVKKKTCIC
ncbi:DNA alkylation repair protein [Bacillus sp. AFS055030]|uniref:DNA alkylation repair protein n=1 Tax=Bacillus sp. AFS055030 TaxID=2033507 RepID=UPI000BFDAFD5|nr:DNA alkylation repair protein [Bacillus sp. AFS055030]PGL71401.1 DNA alkylation repair protein [Bacillus sp. AFS055030]